LFFPLVGLAQVQIGQDIYCEGAGDLSGVVATSAKANIIAVAAPENNSNGTIQVM